MRLRTRAAEPDRAIVLPETDADARTRLRDEPDPDPLVEAMTERLRRACPASLSLDEWGRPLAYRHVVRMALTAIPLPLVVELAQAFRDEPTPAPTSAPAPTPTPTPAPTGVGWPG